MKKLILTGVALAAFTLGAFAQGSFVLDSSSLNNGVTLNTPGNWYSGTYGLEVWTVNNSSFSPTAINGTSGTDAYGLVTAGMSKASTFAGKTMANGVFSLGTLELPGISPAGSKIGVALVAWNSAAANSAAAAGVANLGVIAFAQATSDYTALPKPPPPSIGWANVSQDLVMVTPVPEPGTFALAGLGAAALLIFRRRK